MPDNGPSLWDKQDPLRSGRDPRRQRLFIDKIVDSVAQVLDLPIDEFKAAHAVAKKWIKLEPRLTAMSEQRVKGDLLTDFFKDVLNYRTFSSEPNAYDLAVEFPVNGGTADGAIGLFGSDQLAAPAVLLEVKGPTVELDRMSGAGRTPVQQLWDYLNARPECEWGILTNCVSFRLYHRSRSPRAYERFTLRDLEREDVFRRFYCMFGRGAFLGLLRGKEPRAVRLLRECAERQREVGDELYELYSGKRKALVTHLHRKQARTVAESIHIAQRLLDRIIFVAFCEDRGLIRSKTLKRTYESLPPFFKVTNPRWQNFLHLFHAIDKGHRDLDIDGGYNGGLFEHDPRVDDLQLSDEWTDFFHEVGEFDFRDEVNVDVLGHLFERSVTELEKLRETGFFDAQPDDERENAMPKSAERKRFGVYYTPPEFTGLLVEQTVGPLCAQRLRAVCEKHGAPCRPEPEILPSDAPAALWPDALAALQTIRICDASCGSGAFLIRAYDFMEDQYNAVVDRWAEVEPRAAEAARAKISDLILSNNLYGVDISPQAVEITQLALWIRTATLGKKLSSLAHNIRCGNSLVADPAVAADALDWRSAFPELTAGGGFDCVIGNPPWERLKVQEREFFSLSAPDIAGAVNAATRRKLISALEKDNPELHQRYVEAKQQAENVLDYARHSGRYPLTGKGDVNAYMLFAELARQIVTPNGRVGLLTPSGIATDDTTKEFFATLIEDQSLILLYDFENRRKVFPDVDGRFKFCALVFGGSQVKSEAVDFVFFAHSLEDLAPAKRHIPLTSDDLKLLNPNTRTCPIFRSRRDADLTRAIYGRVPVLDNETEKRKAVNWKVSFLRMFEQDNDAELFMSATDLASKGFELHGNKWRKGRSEFWPLYEGKMFQAFDHRAAGVLIDRGNWVRQGQSKDSSTVQHQKPDFAVIPRWWIRREVVDERLETIPQPALIGFKRVTSSTNQRTFIAALLPRTAVVHTAPLIVLPHEVSARLLCCFLANINSFVFDYVTRQKIGNVELSFFIIRQLPFLVPRRYAARCPWDKRQSLEKWISDRVIKLTCTAEDMIPLAEAAGFTKRVHRWDDHERAELRAQLDAAYFLLYGIQREDVEYILSTFQGMSAEGGQPLLTGTRQRERILDTYQQMSAG